MPSTLFRRLVALLGLALVLPATALATGVSAGTNGDAAILCHMATSAAERMSGVPDQLLDAISRVETGRVDSDTGTMRAWPWTINAQGVGHFYATKAEAIAAAQAFRAQGIQSMDIGCMQINIMYHPDAFASLDQAFDPQANAAYGARFLTELFQQTGSWPHAAAAYHSQTPNLGNDYQRKVLEAWAEPETTVVARSGRKAAPAAHAPADFPAQLASLGAGTAAVPPTGGPLLGGFGHIIRSPAPRMAAFTGRGLDAYRAVPVAMMSMPMRRSAF